MDAKKKIEALNKIVKELHPATQDYVVWLELQSRYDKLTPEHERIIHDLYLCYFTKDHVRIRKEIQ